MSSSKASPDTRQRFIDAASRLFAEKGFYGASMDQIAREVSLTKQALIHHFGTKEKLYGAVLGEISADLLAQLEADAGACGFADAMELLYRRALRQPQETQLLMRELLDNRTRAERAGTWYLRPFMDRLHALLKATPGWERASSHLVATHTYQVLGAINYFVVSATTLEQMYSANHLAGMRRAFAQRLRLLADLPATAKG